MLSLARASVEIIVAAGAAQIVVPGAGADFVVAAERGDGVGSTARRDPDRLDAGQGRRGIHEIAEGDIAAAYRGEAPGLRRPVDHRDVVAVAALDQVDTQAHRVDDVVAPAALDRVGAGTAPQDVVAAAAGEDVVAAMAGEIVGRRVRGAELLDGDQAGEAVARQRSADFVAPLAENFHHPVSELSTI